MSRRTEEEKGGRVIPERDRSSRASRDRSEDRDRVSELLDQDYLSPQIVENFGLERGGFMKAFMKSLKRA